LDWARDGANFLSNRQNFNNNFLRFNQIACLKDSGHSAGGAVLKLKASSTSLGLFLALIAFPGFLAAQANSDAPPPKKAGVKRLCVFSGGPQGEAVASDLMGLFQGDPTILEALPITNRVEAFRQAEIQKKQCDLLLDAAFTHVAAKSGGGFLSKAKDAAKSINSETGTFSNSTARIQNTNRRADSVGNISKVLTPDPKDKVKVGYKLTSMSSKQSLLAQEKEVSAGDLPTFLEKFANDVVTQALK
jgi:hypothetical protein